MSKRGGACCSLAERMPGARRLPFPAHQPVRDLLARHGPSSGTSPSFFPSPLFPPSSFPDLDPPSLACLSIDDTSSIRRRARSSLISGTRAVIATSETWKRFRFLQFLSATLASRRFNLSNRVERLCRTKESIMDTGEVMLWLCDLDFLFRTNLCVVKFTWIDRIVRWLRCSWELMKVMSLKLYHYNLLARHSERIFRMRG